MPVNRELSEDEKIVESKLVEIIVRINADLTQEAIRNIDYGNSIRDQLEMDSMDFIDITMELRKRYKIEVPKEDYPRLATMNGSIKYLLPYVGSFRK